MMDPVLIAYLAKFGIETVAGIIKAWDDSGRPSNEQIRQAFIDKRPEDHFPSKPSPGPVG